MLVVWAHNLDEIIPTARDFDEKLIKLVWARRAELTSMTSASVSAADSKSGSDVNLTEKPDAHGIDEAAVAALAKEKEAQANSPQEGQTQEDNLRARKVWHAEEISAFLLVAKPLRMTRETKRK